MDTAIQRIWRTYPAFFAAFGICAVVSGLVVAGVGFLMSDRRPTLLMVGDCSVDNFRLWPGERFHEIIESKDSSVRVFNVAEPGALPGDLYTLYAKGAIATGKPEYVVIGLESDRFVIDPSAPRLMFSGRQLRWLPLNSRVSWEYFLNLTTSEKAVAVLQRASSFFYVAGDAVVDWWLRYEKWPKFRKTIREQPESRELVLDKSRRLAKQMDSARFWNVGALDSLQRAKDFRLVLKLLRKEGAKVAVVLLPYGDHDLIELTHTPSSQAKIDSLESSMEQFLRTCDVDFIDMTQRRERVNFPDSVWYDQMNLGKPAPFHRMAMAITHWRRGEPDSALVFGSPR